MDDRHWPKQETERYEKGGMKNKSFHGFRLL